MSSPQDAPKYSVLILGSTQVGKSALIEHIRSYADQEYAIDESFLGDSITSKTDTTTPFLIKSNLPTYEAYRKDTGVAFELKNLATQYKDEADYRDTLQSPSDNVGMRLVPQNTTARSGSREFHFLDTPGFNGTQNRDSEHVARIVNEIISTRSFNLIVFVISSKCPLTEEKLLALEFFANLVKLKYSVLIMGKTQAGKSTLIEHIKNYVNPSYAIDSSLLGNGNLSKTESTRPFYVESNLPVYEVYRKDNGEVIDLDDLPSKFDDEEDYRDILFSRERDVGLRQAHQDPSNPSDNIEFQFLDSLDLENADENDSNYAAMIIDKLIHIQTFNLIIITESYKNLLTQEQQLHLEYFANVFKGLHSRIMFLHTHVDYTNIHPSNSTHHRNMKMKNKALSKLFRRYDNEVSFDEDNFKEYPSLTIDLVSNKRPVITGLIRNSIREILKMATRPAVIFDTSIYNIVRVRAIPYPTQFTDEQLKQAKTRLQADADKFDEEQAEEEQAEAQDMMQLEGEAEVQVAEDMGQAEVQSNVQVAEQAEVIVDLPTSARSSRVLSFPKGQFYIQSPIADLVLDIETGFLKDPLKAGARVELAHKKPSKHNAEPSLIQQEQQQWRAEEGYIINTRTGHVLDIQGGVIRSGTRVIQNVCKTGTDAAGQHWLNYDGVLTLASNSRFVVTIDGDATRDGTRITIQEKKPYYEKQKWLYLNGFDTRPLSPSPSRAESISIRPDNFPTSWFYIKSAASGL
ncbi:hypothetical protein BGZ82_011834, partial [Podila clonocystis]